MLRIPTVPLARAAHSGSDEGPSNALTTVQTGVDRGPSRGPICAPAARRVDSALRVPQVPIHVEPVAPHHRSWFTVVAALSVIGASGLLFASPSHAATGRASKPSGRAVATPASPVANASGAAPMSCYDLPVSSAVVAPQSCWKTGATSALVAGLEPGKADAGAVVIIQGQSQNLTTLPGSGSLQIIEANAQSACVRGGPERFRSVDLVSGTVSGAWSAQCSLSKPSSATVSPPVTGPPSSAATVAPKSSVIRNGNAAVPGATNSYYEYYSYYSECTSRPSGNCPLYQQGATTQTPTQNGLIVLDFGSPCYLPADPSVYGVEMFFQPTCISDASLTPMVENWISGYEAQNPNSSVNLTLALGTSNSYNGVDPNYALTAAQMTASGQDWYQDLVGAISVQGLPSPLTVWGGDDMEQSSDNNWSQGAPTVAWVQGFGAASPSHSTCQLGQSGYLADYGDDILGGTGAEDGWTVTQVYDVAWGMPAACAEPEIYFSDMATEWEALNQWAAGSGLSPISFSGVMTEVESGTLSPYMAWSALESDSGQSPQIPSITTIAWTLQGQPPPSPSVAMLRPSEGPTSGGSQVVIYGSSFLGAESVDFGGDPATSFVIDDGDLITAVAPSGSAGQVEITVTTPEGPSAVAGGAQFTYAVGPLVGNVSPHSGPVGGGTTMSITGSDFEGSGIMVTAVHIGSTAITSACPASSCFTVDSQSQISVTLPSHPAGQVDVTVTTSVGTTPTADGDKFTFETPELIAVNGSSTWRTTSTFTGFSPPVQASQVPFYGTVATLIGDVNGDGVPDLIAVNTNSVWVMLGTSTGFLAPEEWSSAPFSGSQATIVGDVTGDGMTDLIAVNGNSTWVMLSDGTGFLPPAAWSSEPFYGSSATLAGDVSGDGMADLVAVNATSTWVMASTGTGFTSPEKWSSSAFYGTQATVVGSVTGSAAADLVAVNASSTWVMASTGMAFTSPANWSSTAFYGTQTTLPLDANGDGSVDLIAVDAEQVWVMASDGVAFEPPATWLNAPFYGSIQTLEAG
jgi:hypothetical protein